MRHGCVDDEMRFRRLCGQLDKADHFQDGGKRCSLDTLLSDGPQQNCLAHPAGPPFSRKNESKLLPCFAFAPGVPQGPAPAAFGLDIRGRGRVDDHSDGVGAVLLAKPEELRNVLSRRLCLITSPQLNIELKYGSESWALG